MRFYCISARARETQPNNGPHMGFTFFSSYEEVQAFRRCEGHLDCDVTVIQVELTKAGILAALNLYAGHPDNG
jgi:hypothetical protein